MRSVEQHHHSFDDEDGMAPGQTCENRCSDLTEDRAEVKKIRKDSPISTRVVLANMRIASSPAMTCRAAQPSLFIVQKILC